MEKILGFRGRILTFHDKDLKFPGGGVRAFMGFRGGKDLGFREVLGIRGKGTGF